MAQALQTICGMRLYASSDRPNTAVLTSVPEQEPVGHHVLIELGAELTACATPCILLQSCLYATDGRMHLCMAVTGTRATI